VLTRFIAEFWNTVSNIVIMGLCLVSLISAKKFGLGSRFYLLSLSSFVIGLGSWMFHMTLWHGMQLWDELSMMAFIGLMLLTLETTKDGTPLHKDKLAWFLVIFLATIVGVYLKLDNPALHQAAFAALILTSFYRIYHHHQRLPDIKCVHNLAKELALLSFFGMLFAFFLWNIDNECCSTLRVWRSHFGWPYEALLQFHAVWHVLTGLAAHAGILVSQYIHICVHDDYRKVQAQYILGIPIYLKQIRPKRYE